MGQTGNQAEIQGKLQKLLFRLGKRLGNVSYPIDQNGAYPVGPNITRFASNPDIQWEFFNPTSQRWVLILVVSTVKL